MNGKLPARQAASPPIGARRDWSTLIGVRCGLALRDAQVPALADVVAERMQARGLTSPSEYYQMLEAEGDGGPEWTDLMDRIVSHETSFFRHMPTFDAVRRLMPELRARARVNGTTLTLWSAGCSTGEEAYSLAMTVIDDEPAAPPFAVWGTDISRRVIDTARGGHYAGRSLATVPRPYRQRFFRAIDDGGTRRFAVADELRQRVRFVSANLYAADASFLNYDVILCQNVLIYFAQPAIPHLGSLLASRLNPGGYLLFGPGEWPADSLPGLEAINVNGVRAFRRVGRATGEVRS